MTSFASSNINLRIEEICSVKASAYALPNISSFASTKLLYRKPRGTNMCGIDAEHKEALTDIDHPVVFNSLI